MLTCICAGFNPIGSCCGTPPPLVETTDFGCLARFLVLTTEKTLGAGGRCGSLPPLGRCGVHLRPRRLQRVQGASSSRLHFT